MSYKAPVRKEFEPGVCFTGKWNKGRYKLVKLLGKGANGSVYLAEKEGRLAAVKVSEHAAELALEFKVLTSIVQDDSSSGFGPLPIELDDWVDGNSTLFFYSMEYIKGESVAPFVSRKGPAWIGAFLLQLLGNLQLLHAKGYCFGDLKAENLLIDKQESRLRLVDFGGVTEFGKSVREYTEWSDRAFWNAGSRRADPAYDLFAAAQLLVKLSCPKLSISSFAELDSTKRLAALYDLLRMEESLKPWKPVLTKAWAGRYSSAREMRADVAGLRQEWLHPSRKKTVAKSRNARKKMRRKWDWTDWSMIGAGFLAVTILIKMFLP